MNKREALRLNEVALNFIDLVHCMHSGSGSRAQARGASDRIGGLRVEGEGRGAS